MNADNLGVNNDPYGHHHLTHPHLLPPHHSQHSSALYCPTSTSYSELFSPFPTDFINSHENGSTVNAPPDYLTLQNSLDYVVSHQHHQNTERTSSAVNASPSQSFTTNSGYSSAADYYNASLLNSKTVTNNTNNNRNNTPTNTNNHSPYDGTSTASTSSPPQSTNYLNSTVKQENIMPPPFTIDLHNNYGNTNSNNNSLNLEDYGSSIYHPSTANVYSPYSQTGLLQPSYPVGPYGVSHPDHMRLYGSPLKHDFSIDMRLKLVGNQRASPNTDISPSQLCAVCQDSAQCQHYGVRTCEGCKGFFKRTVQKNAKYVCLADKNCPVDKRRRNRCQYCRFQTCLAVGMDKEVVRSDALKGRRGRLPSKPKSPNTRQPNSFQTQFCRFYNDSVPNPVNHDFSKLNYRTVTNKESLYDEKLLVYDAFTRSCDVIKQWVDKFCLFYSIQNTERDRLYSNCLFEQIIFRTATRVDGDRIVLCSGIVVHKIQMNCLLGDVAQQIYDYSSTLKTLKIDSIIAATLASILLLDSNNPDYVYHQMPLSSTVTDLYQKIVDSLKDHLKQLHEDSSTYLQLLERFNDARRIAHNFRKRLLMYRHSNGITNSMNTLLDLVLESKPISTDIQTQNEENSTLPFIQYDV